MHTRVAVLHSFRCRSSDCRKLRTVLLGLGTSAGLVPIRLLAAFKVHLVLDRMVVILHCVAEILLEHSQLAPAVVG